jgi:hypothetical protein
VTEESIPRNQVAFTGWRAAALAGPNLTAPIAAEPAQSLQGKNGVEFRSGRSDRRQLYVPDAEADFIRLKGGRLGRPLRP